MGSDPGAVIMALISMVIMAGMALYSLTLDESEKE